MKALYCGRKVPKGTSRYTAIPPPQDDHLDITWNMAVMQEMEEAESVNSTNGNLYKAHPSYRKWWDNRGITWLSRADMREAIRQEWV